VNALFNPGVPVHPGALKVQGHVTPEQQAQALAKIEQAPVFKDSTIFTELQTHLTNPDVMIVAHNAPFDIGMLNREGLEVPRFICTLKVWQWMDGFGKLEKHSLQFLRKHYNVEPDAKAHDALGDVIVLEALFDVAVNLIMENMPDLDREAAINKMETITGKALLLKKMPFGKHKGKLFTEIPKRYLQWILSQKTFDSNVKMTAQRHLEAR
jgi:DNA polymerase-3 subunit epsilon